MVAVTTSKEEKGQIERGQKLAAEIGCPFIFRGQQGLRQIMRDFTLKGIIVVEIRQLTLHISEGAAFYFHPNMVKHRAHAFLKGQPDLMLKAMDLKIGSQVLDCTLGLGSDALLASLAVGNSGQVVGLEASPIIAALVKHGLNNYPWEGLPTVGNPLAQAASRIQVMPQDYVSVLKSLPGGAFDVVYFDPMFEQTIDASKGITLLRHWGCKARLGPGSIQEAARVARKRVVVKLKRGSKEYARLGLRQLVEGRRRISYGILRVDGG